LDEPEQTDVFPEIVPGMAGAVLSVMARDEGAPFPQAEVGVTVILPAVLPRVTVMELVLVPAVMLDPDGTVQL
jgi:hypothetical protein